MCLETLSYMTQFWPVFSSWTDALSFDSGRFWSTEKFNLVYLFSSKSKQMLSQGTVKKQAKEASRLCCLLFIRPNISTLSIVKVVLWFIQVERCKPSLCCNTVFGDFLLVFLMDVQSFLFLFYSIYLWLIFFFLIFSGDPGVGRKCSKR